MQFAAEGYSRIKGVICKILSLYTWLSKLIGQADYQSEASVSVPRLNNQLRYTFTPLTQSSAYCRATQQSPTYRTSLGALPFILVHLQLIWLLGTLFINAFFLILVVLRC